MEKAEHIRTSVIETWGQIPLVVGLRDGKEWRKELLIFFVVVRSLVELFDFLNEAHVFL